MVIQLTNELKHNKINFAELSDNIMITDEYE